MAPNVSGPTQIRFFLSGQIVFFCSGCCAAFLEEWRRTFAAAAKGTQIISSKESHRLFISPGIIPVTGLSLHLAVSQRPGRGLQPHRIVVELLFDIAALLLYNYYFWNEYCNRDSRSRRSFLLSIVTRLTPVCIELCAHVSGEEILEIRVGWFLQQ